MARSPEVSRAVRPLLVLWVATKSVQSGLGCDGLLLVRFDQTHDWILDSPGRNTRPRTRHACRTRRLAPSVLHTSIRSSSALRLARHEVDICYQSNSQPLVVPSLVTVSNLSSRHSIRIHGRCRSHRRYDRPSGYQRHSQCVTYPRTVPIRRNRHSKPRSRDHQHGSGTVEPIAENE
jgi:hypothetical protein